jgi:glycosyltransferase involved in cell wall biosynthesis
MNIAIIHNQFARGGGMESYMLTLIQGFLDAGDHVDIYTYEVDRELASQLPCTLHLISTPPLPGKWRKYYFIRKINAIFDRSKYDISLSLTRTSCQDIAVCGGIHPEVVKRVKRSSLLRKVHDHFEIAFEREMLSKVRWIMAHSHSIKDEILRNYEVESRKICTLFPPIDPTSFGPDSDTAHKQTAHHPLRFLFPSCGHQCKGLAPLLQAFDQLDPHKFELFIAGDDIPANTPANVQYLGYIHDMATLYNRMDFTILPSDYEAFGLVIPESLQCLTPVITTKNVGSAPLISEGEGIVMEDNRPETIVATLEKLSTEDFHIQKNFVARNALTVEQHILAIKEHCRQQKQTMQQQNSDRHAT